MRTIAVLAVIVYHLKIDLGSRTLLTGGFLGVDLFFVLSGFLITGILIDEHQSTGRISIGQFYWRRARRILPPLLLVMLASLPAAWFFLLPSELERFSLSMVAALTFISNFFWFSELAEYGAQSGLLQPFLHTWSLSIEEQFYLLFPPLLIFLMGRYKLKTVLGVATGLTLAGFAVATITTSIHPAFSFYAPTSRAWEMLAGSLLAFMIRLPLQMPQNRLFRAVPPISLFVLLGAFFTQDLVEMRHPGIGTLPVILSTVGLIWFANPREPVTRFLSTAPMVWIGKLSYSLYLWHFPVFAFGRISAIGTPDLLDYTAWLALTFGFSVAGYHLVEKPFRFRLAPRSFVLAITGALIPVLSIALFSTSGGSAQSGRMQALAELYGPNEMDNSVLAYKSWQLLNERFPDEQIGSWNALRPSVSGTTKLWFQGPDTRNVLIIGDSLSKDIYNAFTLNAESFPNHEFARFNIHRKTLDNDLKVLLSTPNFAEADVVMVAPNYYREFRQALRKTLDAISVDGKEIIVLGNTAKFKVSGTQPLFDWMLVKSGDRQKMGDLNKIAPKFETKRAKVQNEEIRRIAMESGAKYLSRRDLLCPNDDECTLVTENGLKTMYDNMHWTIAGAQLFGMRAAQEGWLSQSMADQTNG